jgi:TLC domain
MNARSTKRASVRSKKTCTFRPLSSCCPPSFVWWFQHSPPHHPVTLPQGGQRANDDDDMIVPSSSSRGGGGGGGGGGMWWDDEDSLVPFYIAMTFWTGTYWYGRFILHRDFGRWNAIHNLHHIVAMTLATLSLQQIIIREHIPILFSLSYFMVDALDCVLRRDMEYLLHASICLILGIANYIHPTFYTLRMNSKATYCELSTPLLHWSKRTRRPWHFLLFAIVFTMCRIVWIPIMYRQLLYHGNIPYYHPMMLLLAAFYLLNGLWWTKILKIIFSHGKSTTSGGGDTNGGAGPASSSTSDDASLKKKGE